MGISLVAAVCLWDEPLDSIERLCDSLSGLVDSILFVDGAYEWFMDSLRDSGSKKNKYGGSKYLNDLSAIASRYGIDSKAVKCPRGKCKTQTDKRTWMMQEAAKMGDHILVIDADEYIDTIFSDTSYIRYVLSAYSPDVIFTSVDTPAPKRSNAGDGITFSANAGTQSPSTSTSVSGNGNIRIYKSLKDFRVGPKYHGSYSGVNTAGARVGLRVRGAENRDMVPPVAWDGKDYLRIVNQTWSRDSDRLRSKHNYGVYRRRKGGDL